MARLARTPACLLALALAAAGLSGCGGDKDGGGGGSGASQAAPAAFPRPDGRSLAEIGKSVGPGPLLLPAVAVLEPGRQRFAFGLFDRGRNQLAAAQAAVYVAPTAGGAARGPYRARYESLAVKKPFQSRTVAGDPDAAKSVYVVDLPIKRPGRYEMMAVAKLDDRLVATSPAAAQVVARSPVPRVGDKAPRIHTPTAKGARPSDDIETRQPPDHMHEADFADVVGRKPIVLVFATPALCQSRVCGPVVDLAEQLRAKYGSRAAFIHMEIYNHNDVGRGFRPQVLAWKLPTEPWAFTIDRRGRIAARLEGAFSASELDKAIRAAL